MYNIYILYIYIYFVYIYYIYIKQFTVEFLFCEFVTYLGYRHNNNCFSDLYRNITFGHRTDLASLVGTYRSPGNISWYRLKVKLILY